MPSSVVSVASSAASRTSSKRSNSCPPIKKQNSNDSSSNNNNNNDNNKNTNTTGYDEFDTVSEVSNSSSLGWAGNYSKKLMALSWDYSCGPLRVVNVGPHNHHWARLHAPGHAVLPRADGTLQHFKEQHTHVTDRELITQMLQSGVAKVKTDPKAKLLEPPSLSTAAQKNKERNEANVDLLKQHLKSASVPLPPERPAQQQFDKRLVPIYDDASSIFSSSQVTTTRTHRSSSSSLSSSALSQQQKKHQQQDRPPSRQQEATQALASAVKAETESVHSELERAKKTLDSIERVIEEHESAKRSSSNASRRSSSALNSSSSSVVAAAAAAGEKSSSKKQKHHHTAASPASSSKSAVADSTAAEAGSAATRTSYNTRELTLQLAVSRRALTPWC